MIKIDSSGVMLVALIESQSCRPLEDWVWFCWPVLGVVLVTTVVVLLVVLVTAVVVLILGARGVPNSANEHSKSHDDYCYYNQADHA